MKKVIDSVLHRYEAISEWTKDRLRGRRRRWPWFDHLARAYERYQDQSGDRLAAGLSYYAFLAFFPLTALAFAVVGYAVVIDSHAREYVTAAINHLLPGLGGALHVEDIARAKEGAGLIGLGVLLWGGLGLVDALREALRAIWRVDPPEDANFGVKKLWDVVVLICLGIILIASVVVSSIATSATYVVLSRLGLQHVPGAALLVRLLSLVAALVTNMIIFLVLFSRLSGTRAPYRKLIRGALFGAVGLEALKLVGAYLIGRTVHNPVYASFAVPIGLLVWINLASRFVLFAAAWTATRRVVLAADAEPDADEAEQAPKAREVLESTETSRETAEAGEPERHAGRELPEKSSEAVAGADAAPDVVTDVPEKPRA